MDLTLQSGTVPIKLPLASNVRDAPFVAGQSLGSVIEELRRRYVAAVSESERTKKDYPDAIPWNRFTVIRPTGSLGAEPNVDALAANYKGCTLVAICRSGAIGKHAYLVDDSTPYLPRLFITYLSNTYAASSCPGCAASNLCFSGFLPTRLTQFQSHRKHR
jgi:hypothetical protein